MVEPERASPLSWLNITFLSAVHVVGIGGTIAYLALRGPSLSAALLGLAWAALTIFSISAGYHRLFAHRTYEAHPLVRAFLLAFGAASFQNSAMVWAADHRRHHQRVDTDEDPYDASRGFWHSHIGWVLRRTPLAMDLWPVPDLERDRLVYWQHRLYPVFGTIFGLLVPWALGLALGDGWGGFLVGGCLRLVVVYHITFSINSVAHILGSQPYSDRNSSRDSFVVALMSMGEGYHNFHHTFPADYRNGVRAHHFDPSKWTIRVLALLGLARNLKRTPEPVILKARMRMEARRLEARPLPAVVRERLQALSHKLEEKHAEWQALVARFKAAQSRREREALRRLRAEIRLMRRTVRRMYQDWRVLVQAATAVQPAV